MSHSCKKMIITFAALVMILSMALYVNTSSEKQSKDSPAIRVIKEYTKGKSNVKLTIGLLKRGEINYMVYGEGGKVLEPVEYDYEIGSISRVFTSSILCKAISEGKINLEDSIAKFLPLDEGSHYPNILSLATHTSGYGGYPLNAPTLTEEQVKELDTRFYEKRQNIYRGIDQKEMMKRIKEHVIKEKNYGWESSDFGVSVLGMVLGKVYDSSFRQLAKDFIRHDLGLTHTRMGDGSGNLSNYWVWNHSDAYMASEGMVSTVTDLLKYSRMQLGNTPKYLSLSHKTYMTFQDKGLAMGLGWMINPKTGYLWHNGRTSSYTSFLGINSQNKSAVVILSNYPSKEGEEEGKILDKLGNMLLDNLYNRDADMNKL